MSDSKESSKPSKPVNKDPEKTGSVNPNYRRVENTTRSVDEYIDGIQNGNKTLLSRAITLIESNNPDHQKAGEEILEACLPASGRSVRVGVTGVPGVGKSTFIESMGRLLLEQKRKLAVLAIDPSSSRTKGSILGDKTRMQTLSIHDHAFIRPSPASGTLGGVARKTRETMLLCEAAGYDTIFIETVGVGQSETAVHSMVDFFLLLMLAGAGDELQGIKRGIMEMADLIAINKSEKENIKAAERAKREYENALALMPETSSGWETPVHTCSAIEKTGLDIIWKEIEHYLDQTKKSSYFKQRRQEQLSQWMNETIDQELKSRFYHHPAIKAKFQHYEKKVRQGNMSPFRAASRLLALPEKRTGFHDEEVDDRK